MKPFFSCQKLAQTSSNCIKFPKERIKTSVAIEMFKTENIAKSLKLFKQLMVHGMPENED